MKMTLQHHRVRSTDVLDSWVEKRIFSLAPRVKIDEAIVRLECRFEESPPFRVHMHLVTPGPDMVAETRDHTLQAAVEKAIARLRDVADHRDSKRARRVKSNLQTPPERARGGMHRARRQHASTIL